MHNRHFINRPFGKTNKQFEIDISLIWLFTFFTNFPRNTMNKGLEFGLLGFLSTQKRLNDSDFVEGTHINLEFTFNSLHFITNISIMVHHQRLIFDSIVVLDILKRFNGLDYWFRPNTWEKWEKKDNLSSRANRATETQEDQCSTVSHEYLEIHKELRVDIWYYYHS